MKAYIAKEIKVGFQNRTDTYTKKLAYIIYKDGKGVLRKEKSWESWRDKGVKVRDFENVPTEGFVLNKGVTRYDTSASYIRVYDPRGFEFEITIDNLLFILTQVDCTKKGLEGKFVYGWLGTSLLLIPENSQEYIDSVEHTRLTDKPNVKTKEVEEGKVFKSSTGQTLVYLGSYKVLTCLNYVQEEISSYKDGDYRKGQEFRKNPDWPLKSLCSDIPSPCSRSSQTEHRSGYLQKFTEKKQKVFLELNTVDKYVFNPKIREEIVGTTVDNFADLLQAFTESEYMSPIDSFVYDQSESMKDYSTAWDSPKRFWSFADGDSTKAQKYWSRDGKLYISSTLTLHREVNFIVDSFPKSSGWIPVPDNEVSMTKPGRFGWKLKSGKIIMSEGYGANWTASIQAIPRC